MAVAIRNVHSVYKKIARYREVYQQIGVRLGSYHISSRCFHATAFILNDDPLKHEFADDLDFYGVDSLKQHDYQTELLEDMKCHRLKGIKASYYTKRALKQHSPKYVEEELPYGTIRYDKGSAKKSNRNRERDELEMKQRIERQKEKARKKAEKKARKLELNQAKNNSCASALSFVDHIQIDNPNSLSQHMEHRSVKEQSVSDQDHNSGIHTSYFDQMYFGDVEGKYDEFKGNYDQCLKHKMVNIDLKATESVEQNINTYTHLKRQTAEKDDLKYVMQKKHSQDSIVSHPNQMYCIEHSKKSPNEKESMDFIDEQYFDPQSRSIGNASAPVNSEYGVNESTPEIEYNKCQLENTLVNENRRPDKGCSHFTGNEAMKEPIIKVTSTDKFDFESQAANHDCLLTKTEQAVLNETKQKNGEVLRLKNVRKEHDSSCSLHQESETASIQKQSRRERTRVKTVIGAVDSSDNSMFRSESTERKLANSHKSSRDVDRLHSFQNVKSQAEIGNRRVTLSKRKTSDQNSNESKYSVYTEARKLREESERKNKLDVYGRANPRQFDSAGFRILSGQTPDFQNVPSMDIIRVLRQNILFDGHDVVAISKPYGLPLDGGKGKSLSIDQFLDDIIPSTTLHSVETMETGATGVMLFGKTEDMKNNLAEKLKEGEVCKKILTITKNVPKLTQGEIDIPIVEGTVNGKHRMALRPHRTPELAPFIPRQQQGRDAVTRYRVLDSKDNSYALLECIPLTRVKHQLRAHLAFGLNCPILGDHKYAHIDKLAPMNLHPIMLEKLKIQQSKVRYLAIHLHYRSLAIPNLLNGRNLFVSAPFPVHFLANMRDLKLKLPPHA